MVINNVSNARTQQEGVTLITVMIILIVVTLLGLSAMRMSLSSLTMATNSQVTNLLFQSADVGLVQFANEVNKTPGKADTAGGILLEAIATPGKEFSYCVTPKTGVAKVFTEKACDVKDNNKYISARNAVATQVSVKIVNNDGIVLGSDTSLAAALVPIKMSIYSTAVLPSFGSADKDKINTCLGKINDDSTDKPAVGAVAAVDTESVTDCLSDNGAVFNTQVEDATYGYNF